MGLLLGSLKAYCWANMWELKKVYRMVLQSEKTREILKAYQKGLYWEYY
jgi:hypothetical protein